MPDRAARYRLATPPGRPGAVAIVDVFADSGAGLDDAMLSLGIASPARPIAPGDVRLRDLAGVDRGLVWRLSETRAQLMPHGGAAVVRALTGALEGVGVLEASAVDPRDAYPEARDEIEARALATLARAASPLAVDLLLDQARRWREAGGASARTDPARDARLRRLIEPPTVAVLGAANIGKSTLLNTLAGRAVAAVADEPGTTRDHVGASLDLGGLVVRWLDTPGRRENPDPVESAAWAIAEPLIRSADLLLLAGDAGAPAPPTPAGSAGRGVVRVALRADLGAPAWAHDASVSCAGDGVGLTGLVRTIREALTPSSDLSFAGPWRFWGS